MARPWPLAVLDRRPSRADHGGGQPGCVYVAPSVCVIGAVRVNLGLVSFFRIQALSNVYCTPAVIPQMGVPEPSLLALPLTGVDTVLALPLGVRYVAPTLLVPPGRFVHASVIPIAGLAVGDKDVVHTSASSRLRGVTLPMPLWRRRRLYRFRKPGSMSLRTAELR